MNTLIISDLHLGARNSRTDLIAELLEGDFDRLVLNGDTVDAPDLRRFRPRDWRVIDALRTAARSRELVLVRGNHDVPARGDPARAAGLLSGLLGTELRNEYALDVGGEPYLVVHGDRFDVTINLTWVGDVADLIYRGVQRLSRPAARALKAGSKHVCGVAGAVQGGALAYARERGFAGVITGHTHFHHDEHIDGLHYLNTGCWVDHPCSYVQVQDGVARLRHWLPGGAVVPAKRIPRLGKRGIRAGVGSYGHT
ncbi:MAG TPA: UDP-2,3-diacylglucosamine diphosphatase [Gemmataceae bacterium]|nr:UDP-2,3-diacylglucosamine diphosphatase [Gemmataceae bacterium]